MLDADLFLELAGIAGVFVGFGALIAVRSGGPSEPTEVAPMRGVVSLGMLAVIAGLAPVTLGRYDLAEHQVWALSSALILVGFFVTLAAMARTPEYRAAWATEIESDRAAWRSLSWLVGAAAYMLYMISLVLVPVVIMLGLLPDLEAALYFTYVVLILLGAGWTLLNMVFAQRSPKAPATREAATAATGGSSG